MHRRLAGAYAFVLLAGAAVAGAAVWWALADGGGASSCATAASSSPAAAQDVTERFVRDVLVHARPACGPELATARLKPDLGRLPLFATRYPLVAYRFARPDSPRTQAVYVVARPPDGGIQLGIGNVLQAVLSVGLAAPDLGQAGYRVTLTLERGHWRVDRVRRVAV